VGSMLVLYTGTARHACHAHRDSCLLEERCSSAMPTIVAESQQAPPRPLCGGITFCQHRDSCLLHQQNSQGVGVGLVSFCTEISKDPGKDTPLYFTTTHLSSKNVVNKANQKVAKPRGVLRVSPVKGRKVNVSCRGDK
jgi:hypothetical protein